MDLLSKSSSTEIWLCIRVETRHEPMYTTITYDKHVHVPFAPILSLVRVSETSR